MKYLKLETILVAIYFIFLSININSVPLFIGDESLYANAVQNMIYGNMDLINHPMLAKTVWAFFVFLSSVITGEYNPFFWRLGSMLASIGTIIVFYKIARFFIRPKLALFGSVILAVDPMFFAMSRIIQPDIVAVFFGMASLYYFLNYQKNSKSSSLFKAGFLAGLSLASKMYALLPVLFLPLLLLFNTGIYSKKIILKRILIYYVLILVGFVAGNVLTLFLTGHINPLLYGLEIIKSQLQIPFVNEGYLTSSPASWFTIPQILTLYRTYTVDKPDLISEVLAFQNPLSFILTLPAFLISIFLVFKEKNDKKLWVTLLLTFSVLYFQWFFKIHMTYYYYILPLIPIIILFILRTIERYKLNNFIKFYLAFSVAVFLIYFPLLNGVYLNRIYDDILFKYSLYDFPTKHSVFCKKCSPRN